MNTDLLESEKSDAILARLMRLHPKKIDLSLGRMERLLARLGNPERKLPPVIHVAGTNGKGSTIATLRAIAEAAGHRVHVYTSPHLIRFNERIRLANKLITDTELEDILGECERMNGDDPITFFEVTTAAALLAFASHNADLCILEVGLGGRLDATNVIKTPAACAITPISLDHQEFLGDTVDAIAREKAGIIKAGAKVAIGPQVTGAKAAIAQTLNAENATGYFYGDDWSVDVMMDSSEFIYEDKEQKISLPEPNLRGVHQISNAGLAVKTALIQDAVSIPEAAIRAGLGWVRWPARLQKLEGTKLNKKLPENAQIWVDGGHNPSAAGALRSFLQGVSHEDYAVTLVLGMMGNKDASNYLKPLRGLVEKVVAVPIQGEVAAASPAELAATATDVGLNGVIARNVEAALALIRADTEKRADKRASFILISGSLYLAGQALNAAGVTLD